MSKVVRSALSLMIVTLIAKFLGFAREIVLASTYGTSTYSDIYLTALNIPNVIFAVIGVALNTTFIPLYFDIKSRDGNSDSIKYTNNMINIISIISIVITLVGIIFAEEIVKVFAIGFEGETLAMAIKFTRILLLGLMFTSISNIITSYLQANNNFVIPGLISIPYNIIIIISMLMSIRYGVYVMVWGTLIGVISQFIFQLPFAYKIGYKYKLYFNIKNQYIKQTIYLVAPVIIGVAANQFNAMIDRTLASTLAEGSISSLNYANKLNGFVMALFITSISSIIYPMLSNLISQNKRSEFNDVIIKALNSIILIIIPISVGSISLANPIVKLLFERGAFDKAATDMTALALIFYSVGMIGYALRDILGKIFYSLKDTKTPLMNGIISMFINIVLNLILVRFMGHSGLAFATSISGIICSVIFFKSLKKKVDDLQQDKIIKVIIKSMLAAFLMGIIARVSYNKLSIITGNSTVLQIVILLISILIGAVVYYISINILRIEEVNIMNRMLNQKLSKNK